MARIGHQIGDHRPPAQPGRRHRQHIAHHHHQVVAVGDAKQQGQAPQQVAHLALKHFREPAPEAGVAEAAGAVFAGAAEQGDGGLVVGAAMAHQGQGLGPVAPGPQFAGDQGAAEVFAVAIAEQQDRGPWLQPGLAQI